MHNYKIAACKYVYSRTFWVRWLRKTARWPTSLVISEGKDWKKTMDTCIIPRYSTTSTVTANLMMNMRKKSINSAATRLHKDGMRNTSAKTKFVIM